MLIRLPLAHIRHHPPRSAFFVFSLLMEEEFEVILAPSYSCCALKNSLGIIPATILVALEERLQKESGNSSLRIADCFDMIAGTSTGNIQKPTQLRS